MIDGSTDEIVDSLTHWATNGEGRMALISYSGELSRISAVERFREALETKPIVFHTVELPVRRTPEEIVDYLTSALQKLAPGVACISGFGGAFRSKNDAKRAIGLLNYRREQFGSLALCQVWWMPKQVADIFQNNASATLDWFSFRLSLDETLRPDQIGAVEQQIGRDQHRDAEGARDLAGKCHKILPWLIRWKRPRISGAIVLSVVAAGALQTSGQVQDAKFILQFFLTSIANAAGWNTASLDLLVEDLIADARLKPTPRTAKRLYRLGRLLDLLGESGSARLVLERVLEIRQETLGTDHADMAPTLASLAGVLKTQGQISKAAEMYEQSLKIYELTKGPDHPDTATTLDAVAIILKANRQFDKALPMMERALAIRENRFGAEHRQTALSLNNLASLLQAMGNKGGALALYERALSIDEKLLGPDHPDTALKINNIACLLEGVGQKEAALPLYQRALAIRENALGPDHKSTASSLTNLAHLLSSRKEYNAALPLCERAVAINEKTLGPDHVETGTSLKTYGSVLFGLKRFDEALAVYNQTLSIYEARLGVDHENYAATLNNIALTYSKLAQYENAVPFYERCIDILTRTRPANYPSRLTMMRNYEFTLRKLGRDMDADQMLWRIDHDKSAVAESPE